MLDLMNEPDVFGMKWEDPVTFKDIKFPSLTDLYLPTMRVRPPPFSSLLLPLRPEAKPEPNP